jgi:phosphoribosylglycinamide formyltransferase-1
LKTVVLISGIGTTLRNLLEYQQRGELATDIGLVVSSRPDAPGLEYATGARISQQTIVPGKFASDQDYSGAVFGLCRRSEAQLVLMAGFLRRLPIPADFVGRVMNIHPSLLPAFGGKGYYGLRVHQAVLDYGAKVTGCTVHFVDDHYDHGPIILQRSVSVAEDDTAERLAARVFAEECRAYPQAIGMYADGRLSIEGRRVRVAPSIGT